MSTPILGQNPESNNPLLVLAKAIREANVHLGKMAKAMPNKHVYQLHPAGPNQWMVYCNGCSEDQERYVWPCEKAEPDSPVPPSGFVAEPPAEDPSA